MPVVTYFGDGSTRTFATPGASGGPVSVDIFSPLGGAPNETLSGISPSSVTFAVAPVSGARVTIDYPAAVHPRLATDASGNSTALLGPNGEIVLPLSVSAVAYTAGRVTGYTSAGVAWTVNYNANGTISTVVGGGRTLTFTYNADGTVATALWS